MQCPSCANDIPEQSNFCGFCGHRLERPAPPPAERPAAAPASIEAPESPELTDELMRTSMGATLIGAPAFPPEEPPVESESPGDDINATQAMTALGAFDLEGQDTATHGTVETAAVTAPEPAVVAVAAPAAAVASAPAPAPVAATPVAAAPARATGPEPIAYRAVPAAMPRPQPRVEEPSVIVDTAVQREAAALEEAVVTARDLGDGAPAADLAPAAAPKVEVAAPAPARAEPPKAEVAAPAPARAEPPKAEPAKRAEPVRAEPPKAERAKKAEPARAEPAQRPASSRKSETTRAEASKKPAAAPAPAGGGDFRETAWFMQAIDPEKLGDIERDDPSARQDRYKEGSEIVDTQQRRQFSLNANAAPPVRETNVRQARLELEKAEGGGVNKALVLGIVVAVLGGLGGAAWFLFAGR